MFPLDVISRYIVKGNQWILDRVFVEENIDPEELIDTISLESV